MKFKSTFIICSSLLIIFAKVPAKAGIIGGGPIFELSISGKTTQTDVILNPGVKPIQGPVNDKVISKVLKGEMNDFSDQYLHVDGGNTGKFYLYFDNLNSWRVASNPNGADTTTLTGQVDNVGNFIMFGTYNFAIQGVTPPLFQCTVVGKATFIKGSYTPKSVTGTLYFSSTIAGEMATLKFKSTKIVS